MELFSQRKNYLNIIFNDNPFEGKPESIFDPQKFEKFYLITYVSSPGFFFQKVKSFKKVIAILGEEEAAGEFYQLNPFAEERFIQEIGEDRELIEKILKNDIELRYLKPGEKIHSKIYILLSENSTVVAIGSANFTQTAFSNKNQYEELLVYDSSYKPEICQLYLKRFEEIYKNSLEFFTTKTKRKLKDTLKTGETAVIQSNSVFIVTTEEKTEMIIEKVNKAASVINSATPLVVEVQTGRAKLEEKLMEIERIEKIVEHVTRKSKSGYSFETKDKLRNLKGKLKEFVSKSHKRSQELLDKRNWLYFNKSNFQFYLKEEDYAVPYVSEMEKDELRDYLTRLTHFIESYYIFSTRKDREVLKRCFEAILFAFTSPFIWMMRREVKKERSEEKVAEIPIILILGGLANTGKTKLLLFINKLLGNNFEVFNYKDVYHRNQRILYDLFNTSNLFPILVDEIYDNFFKGEGERLIKTLTNTLTEPHPCLIGTSNIGFSAEAQVIRRIYYLHFESPFPEDKETKEKADLYFEEKVGHIDDKLFRYFLQKFTEFLNEKYFKLEDPLYGGRIVFKSLFEEAGLSLPDFISDKPCGDYYKIGSIEWQALYFTKKEAFKKMKEGGEEFLVIDLRSLYDAKDAEQLKNKLPPSIIKSSGTPLILYKDRFFDFIGYREGFIERVFRWRQ